MLIIWEGSVLTSILPQLAMILGISLVALFGNGSIFGENVPLDTAPFSLLGISLAIFLGFRNNASYQRYLEARQHWGHVLISSRNLVSQALSYLPADKLDHQKFANSVILFSHLLRHQLRASDPAPDIQRLRGADAPAGMAQASFRPVWLLHQLRQQICSSCTDAQRLWLMDQELSKLSDAIGGCERLASTPIPFPYGVLLHRTVYAYCFLLPFGLVHAIGATTPMMSVLVAYTLFALEAIAQEIADPFGINPNSLALEAICRSIERSLQELAGLPLSEEIRVGKGFQLN